MSMKYCPIMSTLGYVMSPSRDKILLSHRIARETDDQYGKFNGLGGHMEPSEDIATCMMREIREEAGIEVTGMSLRGTVNWTGFGPSKEDWLAFIFLITSFTGVPFSRNNEGTLAWHPIAEISKLPMWEGDRFFLPLVFDDDPRHFHGCLPYKNGYPVSWKYVRL